MNKDAEEKILMLLRTLAEKKNWKLVPVYDDISGKFIENKLFWIKEHYDPMYVAQDLLDQINE